MGSVQERIEKLGNSPRETGSSEHPAVSSMASEAMPSWLKDIALFSALSVGIAGVTTSTTGCSAGGSSSGVPAAVQRVPEYDQLTDQYLEVQRKYLDVRSFRPWAGDDFKDTVSRMSQSELGDLGAAARSYVGKLNEFRLTAAYFVEHYPDDSGAHFGLLGTATEIRGHADIGMGTKPKETMHLTEEELVTLIVESLEAGFNHPKEPFGVPVTEDKKFYFTPENLKHYSKILVGSEQHFHQAATAATALRNLRKVEEAP